MEINFTGSDLSYKIKLTCSNGHEPNVDEGRELKKGKSFNKSTLYKNEKRIRMKTMWVLRQSSKESFTWFEWNIEREKGGREYSISDKEPTVVDT